MKCSGLALLIFVSAVAGAQKKVTDTSGAAGTWKGSSICQVKSSPCNNEVVIYYITPDEKPHQYAVQMNKIVDGKEEDMARIPATYDARTHKLTGIMNNYPAWKFTVTGNRIDGTLVLADGTLYRIIHVERERK